MKMVPIEWNADGTCKDTDLFERTMQFCEREFGKRLADLGKYQRVFVAVRDNGEVNAIGGLVLRYDCPIFHVANPSDRPAQRDSLESSRLLYDRLVAYIEDVGGKGFETFVYVDSATGDRWHKFLKDRGAREASRWIVVP